MKKAVLSLGLLLAVTLSGCGGTAQSDDYAESSGGDATIIEVPKVSIPDEADTVDSDIDATDVAPDKFSLAIGTYTFDQLREIDVGGCGMSLWKVGDSPRADGILFFHGIDEAALMMFEGKLQPLARTSASGEAFYGQQLEQTFESADGAIAAQVTVTLGELREIESVEVSEGTISVETQGAVTELAVVGDAGC